jgi:hypothetical protein
MGKKMVLIVSLAYREGSRSRVKLKYKHRAMKLLDHRPRVELCHCKYWSLINVSDVPRSIQCRESVQKHCTYCLI